jgi:N-methylhydantoinase B
VRGGEATFLGTLDRARIAPWGLFGGGDGGKASLTLNAGTDHERPLAPKIAGLRLAEGDAVTIITPGAGGYGVPTARERELIERDVREGKLTPAIPAAESPGSRTGLVPRP